MIPQVHDATVAGVQVQVSTLEHLYHVHVRIMEVVEFGTPLQPVLSGEIPPPASGARFDVHVEGTLSGPKLRGKLAAVDYVTFRADGRMELDVHGVASTDDGANIAVFIAGLGTPDPAAGKIRLHEDIRLHCTDARYQWVNALPIWARGAVDLQTMEVHVDAYAV